jgi:hypothetical protein
MKIRACRSADWPAVLALLRQLWPGTRLDEANAKHDFIHGIFKRPDLDPGIEVTSGK